MIQWPAECDKKKGECLSQEDRDSLILEYSPMIKYIAQRIADRLPSNVELDDLISTGVLGLIDAIEKYDPTKGAKFKTYAEFRVRGAIMDDLRAMDWVPRSIRQKATLIGGVHKKLTQKLGREATDDEAASEMGVTTEEYLEALVSSQSMPLLSLDDLGIADKKGDKKSLLDCLAGNKSADPHVSLRLEELKKIIMEAIDSLNEKERLMVSLYYYEELTMKEIGQILEITESRVSQIHSKAVLRLRLKLKKLIAEEM
jgi:RNA polymerase sigma factor for flagellar operon FliA